MFIGREMQVQSKRAKISITFNSLPKLFEKVKAFTLKINSKETKAELVSWPIPFSPYHSKQTLKH